VVTAGIIDPTKPSSVSAFLAGDPVKLAGTATIEEVRVCP